MGAVQGDLVGRIVALDFVPRGAPVVAAHALHHRALADLHRGTDPHAHHMRHAAQHHTGSPAADQHVAAIGQIEDFLGLVMRQLLAADPQAIEQRGAAFEQVMDRAFPHVQVLGNVMLDQMVQNNREP
jgi:hypothetical protein